LFCLYISHVDFQANKWSLEELELSLEIGETKCEGVHDTIVEGLTLEGASWTQSSFVLTSDLRCRLPPSRLRWCLRHSQQEKRGMYFPIYLNESRSSVVVEVLVKPPAHIPEHVWSQRGVGFILQVVL
jgi:hypothetical protein